MAKRLSCMNTTARMGMLDEYLGLTDARTRAVDVAPRRTEEQLVSIDTNLCSFARAYRRSLSAPLGPGNPFTALEWYEAACAETAPTDAELKVLESNIGELQAFDKGSFAEFRTARALDEFRRSRHIDCFYTDY